MNVSVHELDKLDNFGTRCEIKNLNSVKNMTIAISMQKYISTHILNTNRSLQLRKLLDKSLCSKVGALYYKKLEGLMKTRPKHFL